MITIFSSITLNVTTNNAKYQVKMGGNCDPRLKPVCNYYLYTRRDESKKWEPITYWKPTDSNSFNRSETTEHIRKYEEKTFSCDEDDDAIRSESSKVFNIAITLLICFGVVAILSFITAAIIGIWTVL